MYGSLHDYKKPNYGKKAKPCYMDTGSFMVHIKSEDVHEGLAGDVETRLDTSNYEARMPLSVEKTTKY